MNPPVSPADSPVLVAFLRAVPLTFGNEAFEPIEPFLERAWNQCRGELDPEWGEIRQLVHEARMRGRIAA